MRVLKWVTLGLGLLGLPACPGPQTSCSSDSECAEAAACNQEVGVCVTCEVGSCSDFQQCVRASCAARYQGIMILKPVNGLTKPLASFQARLDLVEGRERNDPPFLTYAVTDAAGNDAGSGQLVAMGSGLYLGSWTAGAADAYALVVRHEATGLASQPMALTIDRQPPTVELAVPNPVRRDDSDPTKADERERDPEFSNAWRRDEVVTIVIKASEPLDLSASSVVLTPAGGGAALSSPKALEAASGCGAAYCATAAVDLAEPPMPTFHSPFGLKLVTADIAGNAAEATGTLLVTRQKWRFSTGANIQGSPVLDNLGRVFFATSSAGAADKVYALTERGEKAWPGSFLTTGTVRGSMVVRSIGQGFGHLYYVAAQGDGIVNVHSRLSADGAGATNIGVGCLTTGDSADGSGALVTFSGVTHFVTVVRDSNIVAPVQATLLAYRNDQSDEAQRCKRFTAGLKGIDFPGNIVASGADVFWGDREGNLQSHTLASGWATRAGWPIANLVARSLVLSATDVIGTGVDGTIQGNAFAIPKAGGAIDTFPADGPLLPAAWSSALGPGARLLFSRDPSPAVLVGLRQPNAIKELTTATFKAAPLFGEKGLVYTADVTGTLSVWDADLNLQWSTDLGSFEFQASPNIDCTRDTSGKAIPGRPGILYLASMGGTVDAIVVDSKGIDTTAPWPKYQHDPRNTGNSDTPLSEFACP